MNQVNDVMEEESDNANSLPTLKSLGKEIATVRKMLDCTQTVFATALGITPQTMSLIERGRFKLTNNLAAKIYFSLYEIMDDKDTIEMFGLEKYQIVCINDLMKNLHRYISQLNSDLKTVVIETKNIDS